MECDLFLKNGTIVDGSGSKPFPGHIAVKNGKVVAVIPATPKTIVSAWQTTELVDCKGLMVCPGFIDAHSHLDFLLTLPEHPELVESFIEQGVTTVIGGNCGFSPAPWPEGSPYKEGFDRVSRFLTGKITDISWASLDSFFQLLENQGISLNLAELVGQGSLRYGLWGPDYAPAGPERMKHMIYEVEKAFAEGACGLSLGLGYEPGIFTDRREIKELAHCAARHNRVLSVHLKAYTRFSPAYSLNPFDEPHNIKALSEMIRIARLTGVRLQISHLIFVGSRTWPTADQALHKIEKALYQGVDIAFDSFAHPCGNTTILVAYPDWFLRNLHASLRSQRAKRRVFLQWQLTSLLIGFGIEDFQIIYGAHPQLEKYNGRFITEIGQDLGMSPEETLMEITRLSAGEALCLLHKYNGTWGQDKITGSLLAHPLCLVETDAIIPIKGSKPPAAFGTYPRILQRYCRETKLIPIEQAIARMTGSTAVRFGLKDRGFIREGAWADITVFDPNTIRDNTTPENPEARPSGIKYVFINGQKVLEDGVALPGKRAGQIIRFNS